MKRLIEYTVASGLVTDWRFATWPTRRSPDFVIATTEGVVRAPSWLGITTGSPPCITATTEFVVPRSIPIILLIRLSPPLAPRRKAAAHSCPFGSRGRNLAGPGVRTKVILQIECILVKLFDSLHNSLKSLGVIQ